MDLLSVLERHKTKTDRMKSLTIKVVVTQTINTCLIYGILYIIDRYNPLGSIGLVSKILNLVIVSGAINLLLCVFPPSTLMSWFSNKLTIKEN